MLAPRVGPCPRRSAGARPSPCLRPRAVRVEHERARGHIDVQIPCMIHIGAHRVCRRWSWPDEPLSAISRIVWSLVSA
jgi:hypothetical protein